MNRREQFLHLTAPLARDKQAAEKYACHLEELFDVLVPERIGPAFSAALERGDFSCAVTECAAHYRRKAEVAADQLSSRGSFDVALAERTVAGKMREVNIDWQFPNGDIDFLFDPTAIHGPRNHEWLWQLNRHGFWSNMARTYRATGDEKYARAFEKQFLAWVAQTDIPENWNGPGSAWRTIECGIRLLGSWPVAFDGFRVSESVSDVTLLLMIASMHRQAVHLVQHPTSNNWLMMEFNGVYTFSALFTELADSEEHRRIAADRLIYETDAQTLSDGMHDELTPDYQSVTYGCAANFYALAVSLGLADEIPSRLPELLKSLAHAAVLLSTPGFTQPRTNDTYTIPTKRFTQRAEELFGADPLYRFVNSDRAEGEPPVAPTASALLPYAGFAVMRSDWGRDAAYLCFDVGALGKAHIHQDKLNINLYKGAEELIFDDGGGQYEDSPHREYALSACDHNTILVDGLPQSRTAPLLLDTPVDVHWISNDVFDYAVGEYDDVFGPEHVRLAVHRREVRFCKPDFFCVRDELTPVDGKNHDYEILFHMDTCKTHETPEYLNGICSDFGKEYDVALIPLDDVSAPVRLASASAAMQPCRGWYVGRNESNLHAATTVSRKAENAGHFHFVTLIFPLKAGAALPKVTRHDDGTVTVHCGGRVHRLHLEHLDQA